VKDKKPNSFISFSGLAFEMLAFLLLGLWAGYKLDEYFATENGVYTVTLSLLSIVAAMIYVIRKLPKD